MLKYANYNIVFQEVPDEVTLAINITNCPNHCPHCHSKYLWEDTGTVLDQRELDDLVAKYRPGITCVCFMGGDIAPQDVANLAQHLKSQHHGLHVGWYSGKNELPKAFNDEVFDYIKLGRFDENCGPLDSPTTNQRMMKRLADGRVKDITEWFRRNKHVQFEMESNKEQVEKEIEKAPTPPSSDNR